MDLQLKTFTFLFPDSAKSAIPIVQFVHFLTTAPCDRLAARLDFSKTLLSNPSTDFDGSTTIRKLLNTTLQIYECPFTEKCSQATMQFGSGTDQKYSKTTPKTYHRP